MSPRHRKNNGGAQGAHHPYWRRAHRDWRVWGAAILMLFAMGVYVLSDNLALRPRTETRAPLTIESGK